MKDRFKKLAEVLRKHSAKACDALQKLFPEDLKMLWTADLMKAGQKRETGSWEIKGLINMDSKGGVNEIKLVTM